MEWQRGTLPHHPARDAGVPNRIVPKQSDAPIAQYVFRRSVLESGRTYSLYADRIVVEGHGFGTLIYPLEDVRKVHLKYEHTKQREYYQCFIYTKSGRVSLRHVHWESMGKFQDRRATYTPFVRALLAELARRPSVQFKAGSTVNFVAALLGIPLTAALAWWALSLGYTGRAFLALSLGGLCVWMIGPSRPRRLDPLDPPRELLPS